MPTFFKYLLLISFALTQAACNTIYRSNALEFNSYKVDGTAGKDSSLSKMMKPYRDSLVLTMNKVVGYADQSLEKKQPSSSLGNFMADVMYHMAREKFYTHVDAAFVNFGGIRLTQLPKGEVTVWKVFELMPFDNLIVLQSIKGSELQKFLDNSAKRGGWPVSGMTMQIADKKAVNVMIGGKPLDNDSIYVIANSDYVANGGDEMDMLRVLPKKDIGYLFRDAIIDYINKLKAQGKNITANEESRVTNVQ